MEQQEVTGRGILCFGGWAAVAAVASALGSLPVLSGVVYAAAGLCGVVGCVQLRNRRGEFKSALGWFAAYILLYAGAAAWSLLRGPIGSRAGSGIAIATGAVAYLCAAYLCAGCRAILDDLPGTDAVTRLPKALTFFEYAIGISVLCGVGASALPSLAGVLELGGMACRVVGYWLLFRFFQLAAKKQHRTS